MSLTFQTPEQIVAAYENGLPGCSSGDCSATFSPRRGLPGRRGLAASRCTSSSAMP